MRQFHLYISTENDAFGEDPSAEIARILDELSTRVVQEGVASVMRIHDANGARVGFATTNPAEVAHKL